MTSLRLQETYVSYIRKISILEMMIPYLMNLFIDTCEEIQKSNSATPQKMLTYSKLFQINFTKMNPYEFKTFMNIVERYSTAFKTAKGSGRGKKEIK